MTAVYVVIKGELAVATENCERRGLKVIRMTRSVSPTFRECLGSLEPLTDSGEEAIKVVAAWFCASDGVPYPDGTLLHYAYSSPDRSLGRCPTDAQPQPDVVIKDWDTV